MVLHCTIVLTRNKQRTKYAWVQRAMFTNYFVANNVRPISKVSQKRPLTYVTPGELSSHSRYQLSLIRRKTLSTQETFQCRIKVQQEEEVFALFFFRACPRSSRIPSPSLMALEEVKEGAWIPDHRTTPDHGTNKKMICTDILLTALSGFSIICLGRNLFFARNRSDEMLYSPDLLDGIFITKVTRKEVLIRAGDKKSYVTNCGTW